MIGKGLSEVIEKGVSICRAVLLLVLCCNDSADSSLFLCR